MYSDQDLNNELRKLPENSKDLIHQIESYWKMTNFLAGAQIYLKENVLLREPLKAEHIKDRLLGHWGTCPGINLAYAHLNRLIKEHQLDMLLVTGPGHGAPANLANLYLEGSLKDYYPELTHDFEGLRTFIRKFSWPGGFPSHLYPGIPGTIHEGGELGYALATSFGAVMDNPGLIAACIIGDGEAETGPTATAWHSTKFLDPCRDGAVLPIVHINGYKISNPTLYGTMSNEELSHLFLGYGYEPFIIEGENIHAKFFTTLNMVYANIQKIQESARKSNPLSKPKWPVILLRTLKGWTGIKEADGVKIEGNCKSHQVPVIDVKTNPSHLKLVENWLHSYNLEDLFDKQGSPLKELLELCPKGELRMGSNPHTFGSRVLKRLILPPIEKFAFSEVDENKNIIRGKLYDRNVHRLTSYILEVIEKNPHNFRIFSPDELESNQLGGLFTVTHRNYQWPIKNYDLNISSKGGQILEILSEHTCQAWLQGYLLTGRHGLFPSYEAFLGIAATMMDQFAKFLKLANETEFRGKVSSLNYLETSTLWRQDHNGFSHQSPGFINTLLNKKSNIARIYLPPDANSLISTMDHCFASRGYINLVIASKQGMPQWLSMQEAIDHCRAGASNWEWASSEGGIDPDVVLIGVGDNPTLEVMAAAKILKEELPFLRFRVVNITDLLVLEKNSLHPHGLDDEMFDALFTQDHPLIFNFHGYPSVIKQLLYGRKLNNRDVEINGYIEEGTTTTPFDMSVRNKTSRYHLVMQAIRLASKVNSQVAAVAQKWVSHYEYELWQHRVYIHNNGVDPKEITDWQWS
jgi:xylulose-5-phosphate/fructose-6-phosphate phosphoketolase